MRWLALVLLGVQAAYAPDLPFYGSRAGGGGAAALPLTSGLAAYWPMETFSSGVTPDVSGGGFDLHSNSTLTPGTPGAVTNYINVSSSLYLSNADNATLGIGSGKSFTLQAWVDGEGGYLMAGKWREDDSTKRDYQIGTIPSAVNTFCFRVYNLANTQVIVTNNVLFKTAEVGTWMHVAAGYDDSLQQIWIQVNNGARIIAPCVGVRRTSAPFVVGNDPSVAYSANLHVDEVAFWTRTLSAQNVADTYNAHSGLGWPLTVTTPGTASPIATNSVVHNWIAAVVKDNFDNVTGDYVPNVEMVPIVRFWNGIVAAGLDTKMKAVNMMAYQYHSGAIVAADNHALAYPLYDIHGVNAGTTWGVYGTFNPMPRSLTINGAASDNALQEYMPTDINPSTDLTASNCGQSFYIYSNNHDGTDAGTVSGSTALQVAAKEVDNNYYFIIGDTTANKISAAATPLLGFYSDNRTSTTSHKVYFANGSTAFAQFGSTDSTSFTGTLPNLVISLFAYNAIAHFTLDRLSYYSVHDGFSSAEAQAEYNLVQAFLVEKGGGYQ
jgi:hypothetical protein